MHTCIHIQEKLGDVVFVELPEVNDDLEKGDQLGVLESVKAVAEVYTSLSGKVTEVNSELENSPHLINEDPLGQGNTIQRPTSDNVVEVGVDFFHFLMHPPLLFPSTPGWLAKLEATNAEEELKDLMTQDEYSKYCESA